MTVKDVRIKLLRERAAMPERATEGSAGYDLFACLDENATLEPGDTVLVGCGFAMELLPGFAAFVYARSGLGIKKGIVPGNCVGVIDSDYRGEVKVGLRNQSNDSFVVSNGDRIAQMVISEYETPELVLCEELSETSRGGGGFGSSGKA